MKFISMVLTVILSIGVIGCSESRAEVNLPTLMCGMCEQNIKNSLNDLDGIKFVNIDLEKKIGKITFDKEKVDLQGIEKAIAMAGYQANDTKADPKVYETLPKCCKVSI